MQKRCANNSSGLLYRSRNEALWLGKVHSTEYTVKQIKDIVKYSIIGCMPREISTSDKSWIESL